MSGMWGADVTALKKLSAQFATQSGELESIKSVLSSVVSNSAWQGPDREAFLAAWSSVHEAALRSCAEALTTAGKTVSSNADAQDAKSAGPSGGADPSGPPVRGGGGGGGATPSPGDAQPAPGGDGTAPEDSGPTGTDLSSEEPLWFPPVEPAMLFLDASGSYGWNEWHEHRARIEAGLEPDPGPLQNFPPPPRFLPAFPPDPRPWLVHEGGPALRHPHPMPLPLPRHEPMPYLPDYLRPRPRPLPYPGLDLLDHLRTIVPAEWAISTPADSPYLGAPHADHSVRPK